MQEAKSEILNTNNFWMISEEKAFVPSGMGIISLNGNLLNKKTSSSTGGIRCSIQNGYIFVNDPLTQRKKFNYTTKMLLNFSLMKLKDQNTQKHTRANKLNLITKINVSEYKDLRKNTSYKTYA